MAVVLTRSSYLGGGWWIVRRPGFFSLALLVLSLHAVCAQPTHTTVQLDQPLLAYSVASCADIPAPTKLVQVTALERLRLVKDPLLDQYRAYTGQCGSTPDITDNSLVAGALVGSSQPWASMTQLVLKGRVSLPSGFSFVAGPVPTLSGALPGTMVTVPLKDTAPGVRVGNVIRYLSFSRDRSTGKFVMELQMIRVEARQDTGTGDITGSLDVRAMIYRIDPATGNGLLEGCITVYASPPPPCGPCGTGEAFCGASPPWVDTTPGQTQRSGVETRVIGERLCMVPYTETIVFWALPLDYVTLPPCDPDPACCGSYYILSNTACYTITRVYETPVSCIGQTQDIVPGGGLEQEPGDSTTGGGGKVVVAAGGIPNTSHQFDFTIYSPIGPHYTVRLTATSGYRKQPQITIGGQTLLPGGYLTLEGAARGTFLSGDVPGTATISAGTARSVVTL